MREWLAEEIELEKARHANRSEVNKLVKYEQRGWTEKAEEQKEACRLARERLYRAWDAMRAHNQLTEIDDDPIV